MTLNCATCDGELGMLRITKSVLRLGHVKEPHPIHAPVIRLARPSARSRVGTLDQRTPERPDVRRVDALPTGLSSDPVLAQASRPRARGVHTGSTRPLSSGQRVLQPDPLTGTPRAALTASRR